MRNICQFLFSSAQLLIEGALTLIFVDAALVVIVFCEVVLGFLVLALKFDNYLANCVIMHLNFIHLL